MEEILASKQTKNKYYDLNNRLKNETNAVSISAVVLFLILNIFKITLFNYFLIQKQTAGVFEYKLGMTALLIIIIYTVIFSFKTRAIFIITYVLQTLYILAGISYYLYFHNYLHIMQSVSLIREAFSLAGNSAVPLSSQMLIVFIDLPVFIYIAVHYSKAAALRARLRFFMRTALIVSLCAIISIEIWNFSQNKSLFQMTQDKFSGESPIVERYGTVADNLLNIYRNSGDRELVNQLQYGKDQSSAGAATRAKPDFVILQVESMDANIINQEYKGSYVTPFLHSLSNDSIYYPYTLSYHEGGGTSDAEFSIINSVESLESYPALKLSNYDFPNSMVSQLSKASYETLAFHGNTGSFYNRDVAFPKLGFGKFYDMAGMNIPESGWGVPDNEVFDFAVNKLKTVKQPFLSYVITMSSHEPFDSARNYYNNSAYDDIQDKTVKNYYNSMSYVDQSIRSFVANIEANFKNTYVIIVGDHTPNINTDLYKQASFTLDSQYFEFVPLMVITPDHKVYKENNKVASFTDIAPTILDASGISFDIKSNGRDLTRPNSDTVNIPFKGGSYDESLLFDKVRK